MATAVDVLQVKAAHGRVVAIVQVLAGDLAPDAILAAHTGDRWRIIGTAYAPATPAPHRRQVLLLQPVRHRRALAAGERLVGVAPVADSGT